LCVNLEPRRELTSKCVEKFEAFVVESGEVVAKDKDEKKVIEYNGKIHQLLTTLEGDYLSNIEGKYHSFGYYCANSKKAQKSECNAIIAFINTLKDSPEIKKAIEERAVAAADAPATGTPPVAPEEVQASK
jgi:hypothetical protein